MMAGGRTPQWGGPLHPLLVFFLGALAFLGAFRCGLLFWKLDRVQAVDGFWPVLAFGLRMDVLFLCRLLVVPAVLCLVLPDAWRRKKVWPYGMSAWLTLYSVFLVFMECSTPAFINKYDTRPSRIFIDYLVYPREVFSTLIGEYASVMTIVALAAVITAGLSARFFFAAFRRLPAWSARRRLAVLPVLLIFLLLGARSSLDARPAGPSTAAFSGDHLVNQLGLSSAYAVAHATYSLISEKHVGELYGPLPEAEILHHIRAVSNVPADAFADPAIPTLHRQRVPHPRSRPLNLVIVLEESLGADYVAALGGLPLTLELEKLAGEGLWFSNLYATGTRSVRGVEAVVSGFLPSPLPGVLRLERKPQDIYTLASLLRRHGYRTAFYYGGKSEFDNMRGFFTANGFELIRDERDHANPIFRGGWGVSDEDTFAMAHQGLLAFAEAPFFVLIFTTSNHAPYEFPQAEWELYDKPLQTRFNAARYADHALGDFIRTARQSPYWQQTLFLIVADHAAQVSGEALVPIDKFRIPALILGPGVPVGEYARVASQVDLAPTLLRLMGLDTEHPMPGRDLLAVPEDDPGRAVMQFDMNHAYLRGDRVVIHVPEKEATQYVYRDSRLVPAERDETLVREALAHALWPSMVYRRGQYRLPAGRQEAVE